MWSPPCHALDFTQAHLKISGWGLSQNWETHAKSNPTTLGRTRIWHLAQIVHHVDDVVVSISLGNPWQPNHIKNSIAYGDIKEAFLVEVWSSFHLSREKQDFLTSTPMVLSNMNMNCTWSNQWRNHNARSLLPTTPRTADLSLNLDDGLLFLALEILDYATSAPTMQLKMRHILCWDVPYATPLLETSLHHYLKKLLEVTAFNVGHTDCFLRKLTWVIVLFCATIVLWIIFNVWVGSLREDPGS